ncbi:MAG: prephenate dehydratase [Planctomycetota bacterium]
MAKKKSKRSSANRTTAAQWKKQIERLDRELVKLLNQRAEAARQLIQAAADQPASAGPPVAEDEASLQRAAASNRGPLRNTTVRAVFRELLSGTRCLLRELRVCYLGPEFSYSHLAAVQRFGTSAELVPVATISSVFDALNRGQADFGLVPIENSTDGRVTDTLDMFARLPVKISGEVQLTIHHHLLGKCTRAEVREVYSKPQALSQCRAFLAQHLPQARPVEMASTAAAARLAAEKPGAAAIASRQAGVNYGLNFIAENIEDNRNNITRFAVIGGEPPKRSGNDKTSLMFELPHEPGALADATAVFKRNQLNLTWIESFPMPQTPNEYLFFMEFQGHPSEKRTQQALKTLEKKTVRLEVLGCYPAASALD